MTASNITEQQLEAAAAQSGVRIETTPLNQAGTRWQLKVYPSIPADCYTPGGQRRKGERGNARWQSTKNGRRVHAVCWHGFRAFFRAAFELKPDASFRTAMATYKGKEHFEAVHPETGYRNVGSAFYPMQAREACDCWQTGEDS